MLASMDHYTIQLTNHLAIWHVLTIRLPYKSGIQIPTVNQEITRQLSKSLFIWEPNLRINTRKNVENVEEKSVKIVTLHNW